MKLDFSRQVFENTLTSNFTLFRSVFSGNPVFPYGRTNRHDEANSHFSQKLRTRLRSVIFFLVLDVIILVLRI